MLWKNTPALAPALGLLMGCASAPYVWPLSPYWICVLLVLGLSLRSSFGYCIAALALGWWASGTDYEGQQRFLQSIDLRRPLVLQGRVMTHGTPHEDGWRFLVHGEAVEQADLEMPFEARVWLRLPGPTRPLLGDRLRLRGYLRRASPHANATQSTPGPWSMHLKSDRLLDVLPDRSRAWDLPVSLRKLSEEACLRLADRGWISLHGMAWLRALLLGQRHDVPLAEQQSLRRSGLAHVLAVSGLHLGLAVGGIILCSAFLPWRGRLILAGLGMLAYASLLGAQASVWRAALMATLTLLAFLAARPPESRNALAVAVIVLLSSHPRWISDLGFRLSISATAGMLWWAPAWAACPWWPVQRLPAWLRHALAATLAAQLATLPWILQLHGGVHPSAPWLNLLALPWLALFLFCAFLATAAASSTLTLPLAWPAARGLDLLAEIPALLARRPATALDWQPWDTNWLFVALLLAGVATILPGWARSSSVEQGEDPIDDPISDLSPLDLSPLGSDKPPPRRSSLWLLSALVLMLDGGAGREISSMPELLMIDVGQGDALLLRDGTKAVLVDGGGWRRGDLGGRVLLPLLASLGLDRLDAVIVSHGDTDHCAGARDIMRYVPVGELWMSHDATAVGCSGEVLAIPGPRWRPLWQGDVLSVGRWKLEVLHPATGLVQRGNDSSLVVQAEVHGRKILLTGDVESIGERALLAKDSRNLASQILKVAHHGSKTSTTDAFLQGVNPRLALISAGLDNSYGHPSSRVLDRLRRHGVVVLRTDLSGLVRLGFPLTGPLRIDLPASPRAALPQRAR